MKYALIAPNEVAHEGHRVAQISDATFEVAEPLFWVEVQTELESQFLYYDEKTRSILEIPKPKIPVPINPTVTGAQKW